MTALEFVCASWVPEHSSCKKKGTYTCKNCHLVIYCSPTCQKSHWPQHKRECRSPLGRETWQPAWVLENRTPSFMGSDIPKHFGAKKYLWGNTPALDVLQLESNEGKDHAGDLRILFAASGDLRNIVKTVARLPRSYSRSLEITINDKDFDIVARNIILLLITLVVENVDEAVDCMIHLWYSTLVRESDIGILESRVRPLIDDVCQKVKNKAPGSLVAKTWTFGLRSLRFVLEKSSWDHLLSFTNKPAGLTAEQALKIRATNALAKSRIDYRDRYMCCLSPLQRIAFNKFRQDGLLLPFGFPRREFNQPNPTFFQTADTWPMNDSADPLNGWSSEEIANTSSGAATADIYGKLFFYIRGLLRSFLDRLSSLNSVFKILRADASSLPDLVDGNAFSRIEVSNISDAGWLGIHDTLRSMVPLLQTPLENPHATLITLFLNAVEEAMTEGLNLSSAETKRLFQYIPPKKITSTYDPMIIKFQLGQDFVASYEHIFNRYMENFNFHEVANFLGATMKKKHTIIDRWPYELKLRPGQPGAQEEFDQRIGRGLSGKERYVEWNRTHESMI